MEQKILENNVVLDLANEYGVFCSKLMADMGATVIKIEPPQGDVTRKMGPFYQGIEDVENSLFHAFYNAGKKSIVLDHTNAGDKETFEKLISRADILLETGKPGELEKQGFSYEKLNQLNPGLILCSITPFGQTGPYAKWHASSELIPFGMAGPMFETGDEDRPPIQLGYNFLANGACMYALTGILSLLIKREQTGMGDHLDISLFEIAGAWRGLALGEVQQAPDYKIARRRGSQGLMIPSNFYRCQDGNIFMMASGRWPQVVQWMKDKGIDVGDKDDPKYIPDQGFNKYLWQDIDEVNRLIGELASLYKKQEMMEEGQRRRVPVGAAETTETVLRNPQYRERKFFKEIKHPVLGTAEYPGAAFGFSKSKMEINSAAPLLGEHTQEIYNYLEKKSQNIYPKAIESDRKKKPLEGVVVLDMGWVVAGPHGGRILGELGATVIRIESSTRIDPMRIDTMRYGVEDCMEEGGWGFQENSRNKLGLALNMKSPRGKEIFYELVKKADVVSCNFAPNGFHKMGIDYESLRKINENIIVINASGLGDYGPYGGYMTFAPVLASLTGIISVMGYEDRGAFGYPGLLADYVGGVSIAAAVTGALYYRSRTGKGQFIDLSQAEATIQGMGPALLDWQLNGNLAGPVGNHHHTHQFVPHNCYECKEPDSWCVISVGSDEEWKRLVENLKEDAPELIDARFSTQAGRRSAEKEIDEILEKCMRKFEHKEICIRLQNAGVSAGAVQNTKEFLYEDPHAKARNYFKTIEFEKSDIVPQKIYLTGALINLESTLDGTYRPGPPHGQDNEYILKNILHMSDEEIQEAQMDQAFV
jgi:crotonobetainyl-CoA:carnitine CoA-transferase CaiB-like acyl-CoA transferase